MKIDVNSDMGEGFGVYKVCDDEKLMEVVSSANIACGFHAGDPEMMARMVRLAKQNGVGVGAHPGLADRLGFGRREIPSTRKKWNSRFSTSSARYRRLRGRRMSRFLTSASMLPWAT